MKHTLLLIALTTSALADDAKIDLPKVPAFDQPPEAVQRVRAAKARLVGQKLAVRGYITWIGKTELMLGADPNEPAHEGLVVTQIPAEPTTREAMTMAMEDIRDWRTMNAARKLAAYVEVKGKLTDAGIVFDSLAPAKPAKTSPVAQTIAAPVIARKTATADGQVEKSKETSERGFASMSSTGCATTAPRLFEQAVQQWSDNDAALYGLARCAVVSQLFTEARDHIERALALNPNQAAYHAVYGRVLYELPRSKYSQFGITTKIDDDKALTHLVHAVRLDPKQTETSFYLGNIWRDRGEGRAAAEAYDAALRAGERDASRFVAYAKLLRSWGYLDETIVLAKNAPVSGDRHQLLFELGTAHDQRRAYDRALEAYDRALGYDERNLDYLYSRALTLVRARHVDEARFDLKDFINKAPGGFKKDHAKRVLDELPRDHKRSR